ncbi:MAG: carbamoyl-phosphate synthase (glutamine-hydrolyzing) large subunit [Candidatus Aenigmarchaeota archaeon]|nr:carbamoyl-phosphate synthase (glutamine-hydrolyzing) large subunit [Candidatus Aenigmarchaeota archaeon]
MPKDDSIRKVVMIGSGGIRIGQAAEFDYSGSQALKAFREEGIETVLVNPNVATIQTSHDLADKVYLEPVTPEFMEKVIIKEKPDGIILGFGGQTALNTGVRLSELGILKKHGVRVLGTSVKAIVRTEDREQFKRAVREAGASVAPSVSCSDLESSMKAAREIGYPIMVRPAYILGGLGSGVAWDEEGLARTVRRGLRHSMIGQVLIEKYLHNWKEVEYEVMRDCNDNCITVCNMENFDPMGVHTGDSIVVAPSQTLSNTEYHWLREISINVVRSLGIVGECNIQFALNPQKMECAVIEINARLSRSSALASKATGYPLAYVAAKLALGYTLPELTNKITQVTSTCFEPSLDYLVVKVPRWEARKFENMDAKLGSQMKAIGEVMAIGRTFEEIIQKAVRMLGIGRELVEDVPVHGDLEKMREELRAPTDQRLFAVADALKAGLGVDEVYGLSGIDRWFLHKIMNIVEMHAKVKKARFSDPGFPGMLRSAKRMGFSDKQISDLMGVSPEKVRALRKHYGIVPVVKQIDTLAAEYPAKTNYLYMTYNGSADDIDFKEKGEVVVLGAGPIRIGSSVEFDWCTMNCIWELHDKGYTTIAVNCNPETVSTDYDMSDKLYFEELSLERVLDITDKENPLGVVVSVGGQTSNNLAYSLSKRGIQLFGTFGRDIDSAEDREKFSSMLDRLGIAQPRWDSFSTMQGVRNFARKMGYPVIIRPSYVLSGSAMKVAWSDDDLRNYMGEAVRLSRDYPVVVSKFIKGAREVEVDGVGDGRDAFIGAIIEHIEPAGVHSGDASMVIPPFTISDDIKSRISEYTKRISRELGIKGPFNIQYIVKGDRIYVIECNLRASRSMPYTSKTINMNLIKLATRCMLGEPLPKGLLSNNVKTCSVKFPMFSWSRLKGVDPVLGVEMVSTGEIACMGSTLDEALLKAMLGTESGITFGGKIMAIGLDGEREAKIMQAGFEIVRGMDDGVPDMLFDLGEDGRTRMELASLGVPVFTQLSLVDAFIGALLRKPELEAREMHEYWRLSGMDMKVKIGKIESGTVIDHLPSNKAYEVLEILRVRQEYPNSIVSMVTNVPSRKHGVKDILKIEGKILSPEEIKKVAAIAPHASINVIKDYEVGRKTKLSDG